MKKLKWEYPNYQWNQGIRLRTNWDKCFGYTIIHFLLLSRTTTKNMYIRVCERNSCHLNGEFSYMPFVEIWIDKIPWMFWMFKVSIFSFPITLCFCLGWCYDISNDYANLISNYTKHLFVFHNTSDYKKQDRVCTTWMTINLTIIRQIYERTLLGLWAT